MRWVASLFALGLMMALFHHRTAAGPLEARATLALGFLLIAGWLGGKLARRVRLPRITGFLLVGFSVGPEWLNLVRADEVGALQFIADAAVALIAFTAGSELTLATLRVERVALTRLASGAIGFPFAAVALVTLSVSPWFPLTVHQPFGNAVGVALVLGVIAAASSPTLTIALMDELDARGPFARSVLGVTVAQDVAVVVLLSLVLAVARLFASPGALHLGVAGTALVQLAGSLATGAALGVLVAQYVKLVRRDTGVVLVALAFVTAAAARVLRVDAMLVALTGGFYVANFSRFEGTQLTRDLRRGSVPVYVAFFALAGAGLHTEALAELWPWVLLLAGLRAVALRYGVRWARRRPEVMPALARDGWLGLISQSGIALGLAAAARRAFPAWGVSLEGLALALIAVHEVVGPICFRRAVARVGELKEAEHVGEGTLADRAVVGAAGGGLHR